MHLDKRISVFLHNPSACLLQIPVLSLFTSKCKYNPHPNAKSKTPALKHPNLSHPIAQNLEHRIALGRAAVVLWSQVVALGHDKGVPLGEESDCCKEEGSLVLGRSLSSGEWNVMRYVPHISQQLQADKMRVERQTL